MVGGFQSRFYTRRDNIMASNGSKKHQKKQTADIDQLRRLLPGMTGNKSEVKLLPPNLFFYNLQLKIKIVMRLAN